MNRKIVIAAIMYSLMLLGVSACSGKNDENAKPGHIGHVAVSKDSNHADMITLTKRDEEYANIRVDTVKVKTMAENTTLTGTASFDERKIMVVTSRIRGRLDKLFIRNPQQWVTQGQPLYAIYSEELLSYENELLNALQQQSHPDNYRDDNYRDSNMKQVMDQLVEGARKKLLLWGLTGSQIAELENKREASPLVTFYSPVSGTLVELAVSEGQYVEIGTPLYRIADLSHLWIESQMYTSELRWLYERPAITVELDAYPNETFSAVPVFDNPSVETDQKISLVRFLIINRQLRLKAGMMAYVNIERNKKRTLVIPKSSLVVGNMITAWVKTGDGMYENRMIVPGIQNKKEVEVISGLKEGELIVTNGAYLLNSALILKKGAGMQGMEGMEM